MGNNTDVQKDKITQLRVKENKITIINFNKIAVIGQGGFGKVWKVQLKKKRKLFAMKEMSKARILQKKSVESVLNELQLLKCLKNKFIINSEWGFQDRQNLYLVMDLLLGGDLRFHMIKIGQFKESQAKFFAACIIVGLSFLHNNGIIHRDIKPQNIVFDKKGYLRITDLGVARIWKPQNFNETSGTPGYMAPQVLCRCNHGVSVDYFALGIIVYQCMFGFRPYTGNSRQQIRDRVLAKQVQIKKKDKPSNWSNEAVDFINRTIQRKPTNRLGNNGPDQIKAHPWFKSIDWNILQNQQLRSPFTPIYNVDQHQKQLDYIPQSVISAQTALILRKQSIQNVFKEYQYDISKVEDRLLPPKI